VAVKLYGDDLDQLAQIGSQIEDVAAITGAADVKLEQVRPAVDDHHA
jgi:cobalt-zinc-cadmium resistance protein CzcA